MADTKTGRDEQAREAENRQRERELAEARDRGDEPEPLRDGEAEAESVGTDPTDPPRECERRDCTDRATFVVVERYQEETGHGAVEATAVLCRNHTADERPANLDSAYSEYVFRVEPLSTTDTTEME